jgi:hypothetical protein
MKKITMFFLASVAMIGYSFSQKPCDAFTTNDVTWYGLDFSFAKMIGSGFESPSSVKNNLFNSWNMLFINEAKKYDLAKFFSKSSVTNNLDIISDRNGKVDETKLVSLNSTDTANVNQDMIKDAIKKYSTKNDKGLGLVFFVESFNKYKETATISVGFFDIATKNVLVIKKMKGIAASGIGVRNYWASGIFKILQQCQTSYSSWKKEFCG